MEEYSFVFLPAIADQGTLEAQLRAKNAKNLVITPTTDEQGETEFKIWTFEGGENIRNIKAGLAGYFLAVGEEGSVTVKTKNQADQLWQFDSHESGLRGLEHRCRSNCRSHLWWDGYRRPRRRHLSSGCANRRGFTYIQS